MRAIVTGGAGFIGSHVVEALLARGDEVHVLDDLSKGKRENVAAGAELHVADIRDAGRGLRRGRGRRPCSTSPPRPTCACRSSGPTSTPTSTSSGRCGSSRRRGGTARRSSSPRRAAPSTASATGRRRRRRRCGRSRRTAPRSSAARSTSPRTTGSTAPAHVSLRLGNVYGPRQEPHGEAGVVAIFMGLLHDGGTPRIFGDGRQTRDYVYVGDVARALLLALDHDGGVFNVGTGTETSVLELYAAIQAASGHHARGRVRAGAAGRAAAERARRLARRRASSAGGRSSRSPTGSRRRGPGSPPSLEEERQARRRIEVGPWTTPSSSPARSPGAPPRSSSARSRRSSSSRCADRRHAARALVRPLAPRRADGEGRAAAHRPPPTSCTCSSAPRRRRTRCARAARVAVLVLNGNGVAGRRGDRGRAPPGARLPHRRRTERGRATTTRARWSCTRPAGPRRRAGSRATRASASSRRSTASARSQLKASPLVVILGGS